MENMTADLLIKELDKKRKIIKVLKILGLLSFGLVLLFIENTALVLLFGALEFAAVFVVRKTLAKITSLIISLLFESPEACEEYLLANKIMNPSWQSLIFVYRGSIDKALMYTDKILGDENIESFLQFKYSTVLSKASCLFIKEDNEALLDTVRLLDIKEGDSKSKVKQKSAFVSIVHFYKNFTEENYNTCVDICKNVISESKTKEASFRWNYYLAVTYYKMCDFFSAKELFNKVAEMYPNNFLAKNSLNYIKAIETGSEYKFESTAESAEIEESFLADVPKKVSAMKKNNKILSILRKIIVVGIIITAIGFAILCVKPSLESQFKTLLSDKYDNFTVLATEYMEQDGETIDAFCIYRIKGSDINVAFWGGYGDARSEYWYSYENLGTWGHFWGDRSYANPQGNYEVFFEATYNLSLIPDDVDGIIELDIDGEKAYFYWKIEKTEDYTEIKGLEAVLLKA